MAYEYDLNLVVERRIGDRWVAIRSIDGYYPEPGNAPRDAGHFEGHTWVSPAALEQNNIRFRRLRDVVLSNDDPKAMREDLSDTARFWIGETTDGVFWIHVLPLAEAAELWRDTEIDLVPGSLAARHPDLFYFGVAETGKHDQRVVLWFD